MNNSHLSSFCFLQEIIPRVFLGPYAVATNKMVDFNFHTPQNYTIVFMTISPRIGSMTSEIHRQPCSFTISGIPFIVYIRIQEI